MAGPRGAGPVGRPDPLSTARPRPQYGVRAGAALLMVAGAVFLAGCRGDSGGALAARAAAGDEAWVATHGLVADPGDTVIPVDLTSGRTDPGVQTASQPAALAAVPGTTELLVANRGADTLSVIDTTTASVTATIPVGLEPDAVAVAVPPATAVPTALVANFGDDTVTPVNLTTYRPGTPVTVGDQPVAVAVAPATALQPATAFVADYASDTLTPIDLTTMTPGPAVPVGNEPLALAVTAQGPGGLPAVLVADFGGNTVLPVSVATHAPGAAVPLGVDPTGVRATASGSAVVVGGASLLTLAAVSLAPGPPVALPDVGEAVALQGTTTAWVALESGSVIAVDLATGARGTPVHVGGRPSAIEIP